MKVLKYSGNVVVWIIAVTLIVVGVIAVTGQDIDTVRTPKQSVIGVVIDSGISTSTKSALVKGFELARSEDTKNDIELAYFEVPCVERLSGEQFDTFVAEYQPSGFVSLACESTTRHISVLTSERGIPLLLTTPSSPPIAGGNIYSLYPAREALFSFVGNALLIEEVRRVGMIYLNTKPTDSELEAFTQSFVMGSSSLSFVRSWDETLVGTSTLQDMLENNPVDALLINGIDMIHAEQIAQSEEKPRLFFFEEGLSREVMFAYESTLKGSLVFDYTRGTNSFAERYRIAYNEPVGRFAPFGYDGYRLLTQNIRESTLNATSTTHLLAATQFFGASGEISFKSNSNQPVFSVGIINDGRSVYLGAHEQERYRLSERVDTATTTATSTEEIPRPSVPKKVVE